MENKLVKGVEEFFLNVDRGNLELGFDSLF